LRTPDRTTRTVEALKSFIGLSNADIAERLRVPRAAVADWSRGRKLPANGVASRLASLLDEECRQRPRSPAAIAARLHAEYGSPRLGNQDDPLDELFFILLSLKTSHVTYEDTFRQFKSQFHPWRRLLSAKAEEVESHIRRGGLGSLKARAFVDIARRLKSDFGEVSLRRLHGMNDGEAEVYLRSLPGVGLKTARCVLMYSLGRKVLPVDTHTYRVAVRLGLVATSKSAKDVHSSLADAVPPALRYAIHTNFVALGRDVCRDPLPKCDDCVLSASCAHGSSKMRPKGNSRARAVKPRSNGSTMTKRSSRGRERASRMDEDSGLVAADIYAGCGGLSAGIRDAGLHVAYAMDWDAHACETHDANFSNHSQVDCVDVRRVSGKAIKAAAGGEIHLLAGGPNCQGVSERGIRSPDDPRNFMIPEFQRLVSELRPEFFLIENVPGLTHRHNFGQLRRIFETFETELGYRCAADVLLAADYGVPQLRYRFFLIGTRTDAPLSFPVPTHVPVERTDAFAAPHVTVWEAIGDLPVISATRQSDSPLPYALHEPDSEFQTYARKDNSSVVNHVCSATEEINLRRASHIPPGGNWKDIPPDLLPERFFMSRMTDHSTTYARLREDQPAFTITALFGNITAGAFTHPRQNRALSIREGARLQSFRDTFAFKGPRNSQYRQIGNAVPPLLGAAVARHVRSLAIGDEPPAREARITSAVLNNPKGWDALPVLTPRFRALFGSGTRWPRGWGDEPADFRDKLDDNYRPRPEFWPVGLRAKARRH
jgi:DNA-cytosine methyltransferase